MIILWLPLGQLSNIVRCGLNRPVTKENKTRQSVNWLYISWHMLCKWLDQIRSQSCGVGEASAGWARFQKAPHSSTVRAMYGVPFVSGNPDMCSDSGTAVLYEKSYHIGPCYNGIRLYKEICSSIYYGGFFWVLNVAKEIPLLPNIAQILRRKMYVMI